MMHIHHGSVDKCIDVMCELIHHATEDQDLIFQAKNGLLKKEIKVPDSECSTKNGRKIFLINCLNSAVSLKSRHLDTGAADLAILATFRCFSFHLAKVDVRIGMIELINKTLPENKQLNEVGSHVCLCGCNANCGHSAVVEVYSKCQCRKGRMRPLLGEDNESRN
ncbi:hypothetical protein [Vibrio cholerae]|nr:hypothetical protein [Vibrio cholerae]